MGEPVEIVPGQEDCRLRCFKDRVVDMKPAKTYIVATDDPDKAGDLAVIKYASKRGEFTGWPYDGPELADMVDGEILETDDIPDSAAAPLRRKC